ncbi:antibiotic biosynthesis monooxygenase [Corynebacterium atypicum]|uniref:Antibiotic biosynthesis monooxygenase n=1 Tax=Corynebacterium atypicum TaxID=191610 RepID=A0ABN4DEU6_9CORY|nr:antibiotic biosynthesis monooxygenase [Corynebacterium atypicum]AIG64861.1 antibiotic biosynthesis monooxygenase [Corynebacterium atypicum]
MSIVKINALTVPEEARASLEERFANRLHAVDKQPGFGGFQLLRPTAGEDRYFVVTWWDSNEAYENWVNGKDFARSHSDVKDAGESAHGKVDVEADEHAKRRPAAVRSEILEFDVVLDSTK